jgi:hypothetical protein
MFKDIFTHTLKYLKNRMLKTYEQKKDQIISDEQNEYIIKIANLF